MNNRVLFIGIITPEKIDDLITRAEVFYLATVDGDKPKVRPLGFHLLYEDKIYFGVGTFKEVYKQLQANQNVEIAAWDGEHFLRYYGVADLTKNEAVVEKAFELGTAKKDGLLLMQCRHCIRYSLGRCKRLRDDVEDHKWQEPLYLLLGDGRRFRLEFDCRECQMNVYSI